MGGGGGGLECMWGRTHQVERFCWLRDEVRRLQHDVGSNWITIMIIDCDNG